MRAKRHPPLPLQQQKVCSSGSIIKVEDHTIVLNSAEFEGNVLKANFTIENMSSEI